MPRYDGWHYYSHILVHFALIPCSHLFLVVSANKEFRAGTGWWCFPRISRDGPTLLLQGHCCLIGAHCVAVCRDVLFLARLSVPTASFRHDSWRPAGEKCEPCLPGSQSRCGPAVPALVSLLKYRYWNIETCLPWHGQCNREKVTCVLLALEGLVTLEFWFIWWNSERATL